MYSFFTSGYNSSHLEYRKTKKDKVKKPMLLTNKIKATVHNNSLPEAVILDKLNYEVTLGSTNTRAAIF